MPLREAFTAALKSSMQAGDAPRTSTLRLIMARVKDADIAARPSGVTAISDDDITGVLRGMVKQRRESVALYAQGNRQDLVDKETAEIAVIEAFLPQQMDEATLLAAVDAAIASTGAASVRDMGRVMAALKASHGAALDMGRANAAVKSRLG
jgi:uncharacterized protein YqeY